MKNEQRSKNIDIMKRIALGCALAIAALVGSSHIVDAQGRLNINKVLFARQFVNGEVKGSLPGTFSPKDHAIYCIVGLTNPAPNATFKFVWTKYDAEQRKQVSFFEQELSNQNTNAVASKFSPPRALAVGEYHVELYVDGRLKKTGLTFFVAKE